MPFAVNASSDFAKIPRNVKIGVTLFVGFTVITGIQNKMKSLARANAAKVIEHREEAFALKEASVRAAEGGGAKPAPYALPRLINTGVSHPYVFNLGHAPKMAENVDPYTHTLNTEPEAYLLPNYLPQSGHPYWQPKLGQAWGMLGVRGKKKE